MLDRYGAFLMSGSVFSDFHFMWKCSGSSTAGERRGLWIREAISLIRRRAESCAGAKGVIPIPKKGNSNSETGIFMPRK